MPREAFHKTLQEIQLELEGLDAELEGQRERIDSSVSELEKKLLEESFMSGDEYLVHELTEALEEFEEEHPRLTELVGRLSDLFAKMGI